MLVTRRRWLRAGAAVAVAGLVAGCTVIAGGSGPRPLVVGVDLALTGSGSALDTVFSQGLELRIEQLAAERERSGGRPVELRVRDNVSDQDTSAANLAELAADPGVSAIITGGCGECIIAAADEINAAAVPVLSLAAPRDVTEPVAERPYVFRIGPEAASAADLIATELAATGAAAIGLVTTDDRYGAEGARELTEASAARGIDVALHQVAGAAAGRGDYARIAAAMTGWRPAGADPYAALSGAGAIGGAGAEAPDLAAVAPGGLDAVVLWTPEPAALGLAAALRDSGWDGPVWLDTAAAGDLFRVGEAAAALSGARLLFPETLVMDDVVASLPDLARRRQWFDSYLSRYGTYHGPASFAADALDLIVAATDRIGTDPARTRDTLEAIRLPGLSGPVGFSPSDHSGLDPRSLSVLRFAGDRWHATTT